MDVKVIYEQIKDLEGKAVEVEGWIRNHRKQKEFGFIDFSDGTMFKHMQVVYDKSLKNFDEVAKLLVGTTIEVEGILIKSEGNQDYEIKASKVIVLGPCG